MRTLAFLLFMMPVLAWAQGDKRLELNGSIKGLTATSTVYLIDANHPTDTIARGNATEGKFNLKGTIREPNLHYLVFAEAKKKGLLFIGGEKIQVEGSIDDLQHLKVSGSPEQDDFTAFQANFNPIFDKITKSSQPNSGVLFTREDFNRLQQKLDSFIFANKDSYVSPFVMVVTSQLSEDVGLLEKRYNALNKNVQQSYFGKHIKETIDASKIGAVGTMAIDFTQNDTAGKPVALASFRGKYVLLDFWASWCGPCRMENPNVVAAYEKFKNKNFTILGVSLDRAKEPWLKAIEDDNLKWTQLSDLKYWSNAVARQYNISSIPQNFLIGPDGKIIAKNLRGQALESKLCELLGCN